MTYYDSYPKCCRNSPNYDSHYSREECDDDSACKYIGDFAYSGHKSFDWVESNNIISFFDSKHPSESYTRTHYGDKKVQLRKNGKVFTAVILDTCADSDCNGCCTRNAHGGYLVDMEYYTVMKNLGGTGAAEGTIEFMFI